MEATIKYFCFLQIKDRLAWRDALEKGSFDPQSDDPLYAKFEIKKNEEK